MNKDKLLQQMRKERDQMLQDTHFKRAYNHAILDVEKFQDEPTPAIDWKPIKKDELEPYKDYLLWSEEYSIPIAGYVDTEGNFTKLSTGAFLEDVTHYVDFNKPEGR